MGILTIDGQDFSVPDSFEGLPHEQQIQVISGIRQKHLGGNADRPDPLGGVQHPAFDAARSFVQGFPILGGLQPKIEAAADAGLSYLTGGATPEAGNLSGGISNRYQKALSNISADQDAYAQQHPILNTGAQIAGGVGATLPLSGLAAPGRLATATGFLPTLGRAAVAGAEGSAVGAADAGTRGQDMRKGAVLGAAVGTAGSLVGDLIGIIARALSSTPEMRAGAIMRQLGDSDALTPAQAQAELAKLGPEAKLADLGPNMQQAARSIASYPGSAQKRIVEALSTRQQGAGQRITAAMDEALGPRTNILDSADDIADFRSRMAAPFYEKAYQSEVPMNDELRELMTRPSMQSAMGKAAKLASDAGESFDPEKPTVMALDYTKRALDDAISSAQRSGNNNEARILIGNKNAILTHMDQAVPEYATARGIYSDYSKVAQALVDGQKVFSNATTPDMLARAFASMNEGEKQAFTEGARQQIAQTMGTARNDAAAAKSLMDKGYTRDKIALLLGDNEAARLSNAIDAERAFAATNQAARGGSMTDRNILAQQIIPGQQTTPVLRSLLNLRVGDALLGAGEHVFRGAINSRNENTRDAIAHALLSRNVSVFAQPPKTRAMIAPDVAAALIGATSPERGQ